MLEQHENSIPVNETGDYLQSHKIHEERTEFQPEQ